MPTTAKATLPPMRKDVNQPSSESSTDVLKYLMMKAFKDAGSKAISMPSSLSQGANTAWALSSKPGNCSRIKGNSLAKMGTTSNKMANATIKNNNSTTPTASSTGKAPALRRNKPLTKGDST